MNSNNKNKKLYLSNLFVPVNELIVCALLLLDNFDCSLADLEKSLSLLLLLYESELNDWDFEVRLPFSSCDTFVLLLTKLLLFVGL